MATAFIFNPHLTVPQFLDSMMADFGVPCNSNSKSEILRQLNNWLLDRYRAGEIVVLIVDEAQGLSDELLEEIRLLTNLETSTEKLLQVVLVGQPELERKLKQSNLRQLRQRVTMRSRTHPLCLEETEAYINRRLRIAGLDQPIFESDAVVGIHRFSGGIPRLVNVLCEHCLVNAFADERKMISIEMVEAVARDFDLENGDVSKATKAETQTRQSLEIFDMVDTLKTFGIWLTSYAGMSKPSARKGHS
jgi:type II secretory pathway predicted ATPase ExeA